MCVLYCVRAEYVCVLYCVRDGCVCESSIIFCVWYCMKVGYVCACILFVCVKLSVCVPTYMLEGLCYIFVIPVFILSCTIRMHMDDLHISPANGCDIQ